MQMSSLAPGEEQHRQGEEQFLSSEPQLFCSAGQHRQSEEQLLSDEPQLFCSERLHRQGERQHVRGGPLRSGLQADGSIGKSLSLPLGRGI